jgi:hypothetical protein
MPFYSLCGSWQEQSFVIAVEFGGFEGRQIAECRMLKATQSHLKAAPKPFGRQAVGNRLGTQSHLNATPMRPQSHTRPSTHPTINLLKATPKPPTNEGRRQNPEGRRAGQNHPRPGASQVQARCLGGGCEVQARYMRGTCVVQAWYMRGTSHLKVSGAFAQAS